MKYLFDDNALKKYRWRGNAGNASKKNPTKPKKPFKDLIELNNLLFYSVRMEFPDLKRYLYNSYMSQWLKNAPARLRVVTYTYPDRQSSDEGTSDENDYSEDDEN